MSEIEFAVVSKLGIDINEIEFDLISATGSEFIPARNVEIANTRQGSKRITHFYLSQEEAEKLSNDPRVQAVEIPPDQRNDISIGLHGRQQGVFRRSAGLDSSYVNWGLRRCTQESNIFGDNVELGNEYTYPLDGKNVDIVIQDSGIDPDHPDWNDSNGNSRLQQIDWYEESGLPGTQSPDHYRDRDGHGSHCASIAAGLRYGWAKGARIYSQKLAGLETLQGADGTGIALSDAFDTIRLWHNSKTNGRPTVVNMSWGFGATITTDPASGTYRGTPWTYGVDYTDRNALWAAVGVTPNLFGTPGSFFHRIPARNAVVDAEIEEMIADGIHICIAAGNNRYKADVDGGPDYDNEVVFSGNTRQYHRGSSPYSDNAFMVGNIDSTTFNTGSSVLDKVSTTSTRGPGVNMWAPGTNITAATSRLYDTGSYTVTNYPESDEFPIMSISGTSMASPQVAGVLALYLQLNPDLSPSQLKNYVTNLSKSVVYNTGSATDYENNNTSLLGSNPNMLFSKFTAPTPVKVNGPITFSNLPAYKL